MINTHDNTSLSVNATENDKDEILSDKEVNNQDDKNSQINQTCIYYYDCKNTSLMRDPLYHVICCSEKCQIRYHEYKQKDVSLIEFIFNIDTFKELWKLNESLVRQLIIEMVFNDNNDNTTKETNNIFNQLIELQADIANYFKSVYGYRIGNKVNDLLNRYVTLIMKVIHEMVDRRQTASDFNDFTKNNSYYKEWMLHASVIAVKLYYLNTDRKEQKEKKRVMDEEEKKNEYYSLNLLQFYMRANISLITTEIVSEIKKDYTKSVQSFDSVLLETTNFSNFIIGYVIKNRTNKIDTSDIDDNNDIKNVIKPIVTNDLLFYKTWELHAVLSSMWIQSKVDEMHLYVTSDHQDELNRNISTIANAFQLRFGEEVSLILTNELQHLINEIDIMIDIIIMKKKKYDEEEDKTREIFSITYATANSEIYNDISTRLSSIAQLLHTQTGGSYALYINYLTTYKNTIMNEIIIKVNKQEDLYIKACRNTTLHCYRIARLLLVFLNK